MFKQNLTRNNKVRVGGNKFGNALMKYFVFYISFFLLSTFNLAQDSLDTRLKMKRLGVGFDNTAITFGPHINYYSNQFLFSFTYGLPSSNNSNNVIKQFDNSLYFRTALSFGYWSSTNSFWPIYLGVGYNYISEKDKVLEFEGDRSISSFSFFLGTRLIEFEEGFWRNFGTHLELGYTAWNYSSSLLEKNKSSKKYNFPKLYFSIGICYYIL